MSDQAISLIDKDARIAELEAALAARDTLIETLRLQLAQLKQMSFDQPSEKLTRQIEQLELALEELEGQAAVADVTTTPPATGNERPAPPVAQVGDGKDARLRPQALDGSHPLSQ